MEKTTIETEEIVKEGEEKKTYELAMLLKSEDDFAPIAEIVRQHGGEIVGEPRLKNLSLAYKIKGYTEAIFGTCIFHAFGRDAKSLEGDLINRDAPIRFMIVSSTGETSRPAPIPFAEDGERRKPAAAYQAGAREARREPKAPSHEPLSNEALEKLLTGF